MQKKLVYILITLVTLGSIFMDIFIYAGTLNLLYIICLFLFFMVFTSRIKKHIPMILLGIILLQILLTALLFPKYTYEDAKAEILKIYNQEQILNLRPKSMLTSIHFYEVINYGYVFEIENQGKRINVIVNPNNLDEHGVLKGNWD
ncbi:hypothetical protein [Fusibacter ferrireducens]|uniref:Uncharacterized protein n=1 Tax=Fusibacter ferrireducens TaxID=2785058 RepID=A0ABR9ZU00_9FIRM|nr:hypothetical protein [Fusibacter ferrireducens]MBF4693955.1 hypothetical protein [Fusibacter ferrireducens]